MLSGLSIRDVVLIDRLEIAFEPGMTVLTGETGAGKSILLDALALALGGRGDAGLVRHGAATGQVTATFDPPPGHAARALLTDNGIADDGELILRRVQNADGRTRAFVNDQPVGAALLRSLGRMLVEIHGQHDERALLDPGAHRALLDAYGGLEAEVAEVGARWRTVRTIEAELDRHRARIEAARREADYLRAAAEELGRLAPEPGEETSLAETRAELMKIERVAGDIAEAVDTLNGPASPAAEIAGLMRRVERKRAEAPSLLGAPAEALGRALDAIEEARSGLEAALVATRFDPKELERAEERLFALRAAARKYHVPVDALADLAARMAGDLAALDAGEERLGSLETELAEAQRHYAAAAVTLSDRRGAAAERLEAAVAVELPALKLERAAFMAAIERREADPGPEGIDAVEFHVRTNPGTRPGPLAKIASGGELSRFLLAIKVALADRGSAPTLVFDEIDTGVGGAVAEAIGRRLAKLASGGQVISVTHAPQVAARAAGHLLIAKHVAAVPGGGDTTVTRVTPLPQDARREEIARMLAGAEVTDEARAAAARLLG